MREDCWVRVIWVLFVLAVIGAQIALNSQLKKIVACSRQALSASS